MAEVTNEQIANFRSIAELYLRSTDKETQLHHAVDKMFKKLKKKHEHYADKQAHYRRAHALFDPKTKKLLVSNMSANGPVYEYSQEGLDKLDKDLRELQYKKVEISPELVPEEQLPDTLDFEFTTPNGSVGKATDYEVRNAFKRFVLPTNGTDEEEEEEETE